MIGKDWNTPRGGGLDRYFVDLASQLTREGIETTAIVNEACDTGPLDVRSFGQPGSSLTYRWRTARRATQAVLSSFQVDLVNPHFALYTFPLVNLLPNGVPIVCHFHGPWAAESQLEDSPQTIWQRLRSAAVYRLKRTVEQTVYRRCYRFLVHTSAFQQVLHREYAVPLERIDVIPGGVDVQRFRPALSPHEARRRLGWPEDRPIVLAVRRLARRMGLENLIDAMTTVRQRCPDALLLIGGRGHLADALHARIRERELQEHVQLVGFIPDDLLPAAYRAANFTVVPTVALEGFGLILPESLACGTPALGTPVGGIPEVLRPFHEDCVFESPEPAAMADRIIAVLNGRLCLPDAAACRDYAVSHFAWEIISRRVIGVFEAAVRGYNP